MRRQDVLLWFIKAMVLVSLTSAWSVEAITIRYEATDLAAVGPGGGALWHYTYHVSNYTPVAFTAFEILFDPALYQALQDPPPAVPDWILLTLQPDTNLPDPGRYSALA